MDDYKKSLISITNLEIFERFLNLLMNDVTRCMDEGFDAVMKLKSLKEKKQYSGQLSEEEEKSLQQNQNQANAYFTNATESINLMANLSAWVPKSFLTEIFRQRVALLLNNILQELLCEKIQVLCSSTEFKEFQKTFKQKQILKDIIYVYTNLQFDEKFCKAIATDGRSYKNELFELAVEKSFKIGLQYEKCEQFALLTHKLKNLSLIESVNQKELDKFLENYPEEFECPLSGDLMSDPVKLPSSGKTVDRQMIEQHLLNDEIDPYNRKPLKKSDLIPQPELKKKINEWRTAQLAKISGKNLKENSQSSEKNQEDELGGTIVFKDNFFSKLE